MTIRLNPHTHKWEYADDTGRAWLSFAWSGSIHGYVADRGEQLGQRWDDAKQEAERIARERLAAEQKAEERKAMRW